MRATSSQSGSSGPEKGQDAMQRMLEGQDNHKLAGAKDALKKKILRLVMQQAIEELGDSEQLAEASLAEVELDPADLQRLTHGVRKQLIRRAAQEVTEADLDDIAEAAAQAAIDNSEADEAAGRVERKLLAAISEKALEGLADDGSTVRTAFDTIASSNASAIDALAESVQEKLYSTIAAKAWSAGVDSQRVVEMASEKIDVDHPSVVDAIEKIQASAGDIILHSVLSQLSGDEASGALADEVARRYKERIMGAVMERVTADPDAIAAELESEILPEHESVAAAVRKTRAGLLSMVRERALSSVEDARSAAREALVEIDGEHKRIVDAAGALTRRLTQTIADRALSQLGDAQTAAAAAMELATEKEKVVATAANTVYETMARHVAEQARERCSDADGLADAARDYMDPKDATVSHAVSVVQTRLTELVAHRAIASLEEDNRMQELAREAANREDVVVQSTVDALREQIMADIIRRVGDSFADAGDTARKAKERMGQGNAAVMAASEVLKELVLEELAKQATFTLLEPDKAGAKAFERIDTQDPRFARATKNVTERLLKAIAEQSIHEISESDETARLARQHISNTDDALVSAAAVLRDILINEVARRGAEALEDTRAIAQQSRARIEPESEALVSAAGALRELLIQDMVEMTRGALEDAEAAAAEAMEHLDRSEEVFARVRAIFKERVLINVLGEAMREIGQSVGGPSNEAAMFQQALQAMSGPGNARAAAWNGSGYQTAGPAAAAVRQAEALSAEPPSLSVSQSSPSGWGNVTGKADRAASTQRLSSEPAGRLPVMDDWGTDVDTEELGLGEPASTDRWVKLSDMSESGQNRMVPLAKPEPLDDMIVTEFVDHEENAEGESEWEREDQSQDSWADVTPPSAQSAGAKNPAPKKAPETTGDDELDMTWGADDGLRCYVYGYVSASEIQAKAPAGITPLDAAHPIRFVTLRGVRAIVSKVSADAFGAEALAKRSKDAEWLKTQIRQHATVLDAFKSQGTVMPVRFGSVFENEADVAVHMGSEHDHISDTIDRLKNKQEWSLRIMRDADRLGDRLQASERTVGDSLNAISAGVAQFIKDEMDKSGDLADDELIDVVTENCIRRAHDALMPWAVDGAQKALFTAPGVDMVFNAAYLVEAGQVSDFQAEVERLSKELDPVGFSFDLTGPWPAYHFVDTDQDGSPELATVLA